MNAVTPTKPESEAGAEAPVLIERSTALEVLTDQERAEEFVKRVRDAVSGQEADTSTAKGRKEIASRAFKVAQTKAALDKARLELTAEWRKNTDLANAAGKRITAQLEELKTEVRKPLTEWEDVEEARAADVKAKIEQIQNAATVTLEDTVESVQLRLQEVGGIEITDDHFQEYAAAARAHLERTLDTLRAAVARLRREAEERAELERLRAAEQERLARERADREAREAREAEAKRQRDYALAIMQHIRDCGMGLIGGQPQPYVIILRELEEKVTIDESFGDLEAEARKLLADTLAQVRTTHERAEEARRAREADEQAERERQAAARAAQEAEEAARAEERRKAEEERQRQEAAHQAELRAQEEARRAAEAEATRLRQEQEAREREERARQEAEARRQADREHRGRIMGEVKAALMALGGIGEEAAKKLVLGICAGEVPHTTINF